MTKPIFDKWNITQREVKNGYNLNIEAESEGQIICTVYGSTNPLWDFVPGIRTGRSNARLIASVPPMYAYLLSSASGGCTEAEKILKAIDSLVITNK